MTGRLSIVTISFNQATFLRACLESVISQKDQSVELIVVDAGSTDGSRDILHEYAAKIDCLILEPDDGPADGLNKGFESATGDYGYFLNSDDFLLPNGVDRIHSFWREHPCAEVGLCEAWMVDVDGQPLRRLIPTKTTPAFLIDGRSVPVQQGMSFKMRAFHEVKGFNAANRSSWDLELLYDFALAGKRFVISKTSLGAFRMHEQSLSGGAAGASHRERLICDRNRMRERLPKEQRVLPTRLARVIRNTMNPRVFFEAVLARLAPAIVFRVWHRDNKRSRS